MGIEPTSEAWEASILPLYDARSFPERADYTQRSGCTYRPAIAIFHSPAGKRGAGFLRAGLPLANRATQCCHSVTTTRLDKLSSEHRLRYLPQYAHSTEHILRFYPLPSGTRLAPPKDRGRSL